MCYDEQETLFSLIINMNKLRAKQVSSICQVQAALQIIPELADCSDLMLAKFLSVKL